MSLTELKTSQLTYAPFAIFWQSSICSLNLMLPFGNLLITDNVRGKLGGRVSFPVKKQKGQIFSFLSCGTPREWAGDLNLAKSMFYLLPSILNCQCKN